MAQPGVDESASDRRDNSDALAALVDGPIAKALSELVVPLVEADGGELYLVATTGDDVHVHLTGTCAGCPGATITRERLIEPAIHGVSPKTSLRMTTGWRVPEGAKRIEAP